jgi:hypothetical protein
MLKAVCVPFLLALAGAGCSTDWVSLQVQDVSYADIYDLALHVIESEGYPLSEINIHEGRIVTGWFYGKMTDRGRFPIRRRAEVRVDPEDEGGFLVRVRIDQEANREGYRLTDPRLSDAWDEYGWDREGAALVLKKIEIQVKEYEPSEEFFERHKKSEELKARIPDVLKDRDG